MIQENPRAGDDYSSNTINSLYVMDKCNVRHSQNPAIVSSSKDIPRAVKGHLIDQGVSVYYSNLQCSSPYPQIPSFRSSSIPCQPSVKHATALCIMT